MKQSTSTPASVGIVAAWLSNNEGDWLPIWESAVSTVFSSEVLLLLGTSRRSFPSGGQRLDDLQQRCAVAFQAVTYECWATLLSTAQATKLNAALRLAAPAIRKQSAAQLRKILITLAPSGLRTLRANAVSARSLEVIWPEIGNTLCGEARLLAQSESPEWMVHERLLLGAYFLGCRLLRLEDVFDDLRQAHSRRLGIRGVFTRIVQHVEGARIIDGTPPCPTGVNVPAAARPMPPSSLTPVVFNELRATRLSQGLFHRLVAPLSRALPSQAVSRGMSAGDFLVGRDEAHRLYEYSIIAHLATAAAEQTLRAAAEHVGVTHLRRDGAGAHVPVGVMSWLAGLGLRASANSAAARLFESSSGSIRNRLMHASLVDVDMKRQEALFRGTNASRVSTAVDPFDIQGVATVCSEALTEIDAACAALGIVTSDYAWCPLLGLSPPETNYAENFTIGLDRANGSLWQQQIRDFLAVFAPQLGQLLSSTLLTWGEKSEGILDVAAAVLSFEAIFRVACMVLGLPVLNVSWTTTTLKAQYYMLDSAGLLSQLHFTRMLRELPASDRATATEVLRLGVKCRNAFAHGALDVSTSERVDGILAILWGAIASMIHAARCHMIREAAYFRSEARQHAFTPGSADIDWRMAERYTFAQIAAEASQGRPE